MRHAQVIGLGKSGTTAAHLLQQQGWRVTLTDRNISPALEVQQRALAQGGIVVELGQDFEPEQTLAQGNLDLVVVSPGVPWDLPGLERARGVGIETIGEMELAWRSLQDYPWIGVTGTNGKTTTTALIAAIFAAAKLQAPACGNIGYAACDLALQVLQNSSAGRGGLDWVIAELSSYQLESSPSVAPKVGIWTTFTPDHLNRHKTLEQYYDIKARLLDQAQMPILNGDDPHLRQVGCARWPQAHWTSIHGQAHLPAHVTLGATLEGGQIMSQGQAIAPIESFPMVGSHNQQNLLLAVTAARLAGIDKEAIAQAIATFPGVPHRLERIGTWRGIGFINDSKATNYDAAEVGLSAVAAPVILIAGGRAKDGDDRAWLARIQAKVAAVLLIGEAAPLVAQRLAQVQGPPMEIVETLERAIPRAMVLGEQYGAKVVLLSPACASFDQFRNFEHRGDRFRDLFLELTGVLEPRSLAPKQACELRDSKLEPRSLAPKQARELRDSN